MDWVSAPVDHLDRTVRDGLQYHFFALANYLTFTCGDLQVYPVHLYGIGKPVVCCQPFVK